MSPLEAARLLIVDEYAHCFCPHVSHTSCPFTGQHGPGCPMPMLPRIVAALEAAEAWVVSLETANTNATEHIHVEQRLIDALRGDEVPA